VTAFETDARRVSIEIGVRSHAKRRGWKLLPSVAFALWAAMAGTPLANAERDATRSAVDQARSLGLAETVEWKRLVHYRTGSWGGLVSDIDDPRFFLSPRGKEDPEEELEATLRAFFAPIREGREDAHALCRFPARRRWLDERLHFEGPMRSPRCPALTRFRAAVDPDSVALVYASNYLGNPGSALGHTFLRIRKRRLPGQTASRERLDFGVEYVAATDTSNPFLYAFKGLSGMFPGRVEFRTFEYKMREYGTLQDRDLWEYGLALTPRELDLLVLHLWEVSNARTDYYYLSQNCAYHILAVLEAAAPRIDVVSGVNAVLIPTDTVKALAAIEGLVTDIAYHPSDRSRQRAGSTPRVPYDKSPDRGHGSMRAMVGAGTTTQYGDGFAALGYRISLHDLADPPDGHPELLQLQFIDLRFGYRFADHAVYLEGLTFAELLALKPLTSAEKALSWRVRGYGTRLHDEACPDCFAHGTGVAVGATIATADERAALFLMADTYVLFSGELDGIDGSFVRVGVGPHAGLRLRLPGPTVTVVTGTLSYLPGQRLRFTYDVRALLRAEVAGDVALGVEADMQPSSVLGQVCTYLYF
jgi:hypothetical protein